MMLLCVSFRAIDAGWTPFYDPPMQNGTPLPDARLATSRPIRVAIVHDWLTLKGGAEACLQEFLHLYPDADLFCVVDFLPEHERGFLRGRRRELGKESTVFVNLDEVGAGRIRYTAKEGALLATRSQPQLVEICEEIAEDADPNAVNLRAALGQLFGAVGQSAHAASAEQQQRILDIVNNARREIYQILGEE